MRPPASCSYIALDDALRILVVVAEPPRGALSAFGRALRGARYHGRAPELGGKPLRPGEARPLAPDALAALLRPYVAE
jgi:hypothetical protein